MRWGNLYYLSILVSVPFGILFFVYLVRRRKKLLALFCDVKFVKKLMPHFSGVRWASKKVLWLVSIVFIVITLAEPKWGYHFEDVIRKGVDIVLLVDVSNSMLAEDVKPNRLERVKRKIYDLLKMAHGDRIGMVVFAGRAILLCPLTLDYQAIYQFLETLSTDLIPIQGTDLTGALKVGMKSFKDPKTSKAMILLTDGEDPNPDLRTVVAQLKEQKIPLYILGIGTPEGAPIPLPRGEGGFKRDDVGNVVISKLAERGLIDLAVGTGGEYVRSVTGDEDLHELYAKGLKGALSGSEIKASKKRVYETRFQWPLAFALFFLLFEQLLGETQRTQNKSREILN